VETNPFKLFRLTTNYQYQRGVHLLHDEISTRRCRTGSSDPTVGNITNIESSAYQSSHRLMIGIGPGRLRIMGSSEHQLPAQEDTNEADSPFSLPSNNFNLHADRGPAASDFRHLISGFISKRLADGFHHLDDFPGDLRAAVQHHDRFSITTATLSSTIGLFGVGRNSARGASRWRSGRDELGKSFGPEQQQQGGPQVGCSMGRR
jgi:hypothetical protein